jgi:hypothetical protein
MSGLDSPSRNRIAPTTFNEMMVSYGQKNTDPTALERFVEDCVRVYTQSSIVVARTKKNVFWLAEIHCIRMMLSNTNRAASRPPNKPSDGTAAADGELLRVEHVLDRG